MKYNKILKMVLVFLFLYNSVSVLAEDKKQDGQTLDQAANDPTASLMSVQIQNFTSATTTT